MSKSKKDKHSKSKSVKGKSVKGKSVKGKSVKGKSKSVKGKSKSVKGKSKIGKSKIVKGKSKNSLQRKVEYRTLTKKLRGGAAAIKDLTSNIPFFTEVMNLWENTMNVEVDIKQKMEVQAIENLRSEALIKENTKNVEVDIDQASDDLKYIKKLRSEFLTNWGKKMPKIIEKDVIKIEEKKLGKGHFGEVNLGYLIEDGVKENRVEYAIKKSITGNNNEFFREAFINAQLDHLEIPSVKRNPNEEQESGKSNVVEFIGIITSPLSMVLEYCELGDLKKCLIETQTFWGTKKKKDIALDILNGMNYVAKQLIVHCDLAARNVLVGKDFVCKIADFGSSLIGKKNKHACLDSGIGMDEKEYPLAWLSPRILRRNANFTEQSDIWAFGCTLIEILTYNILNKKNKKLMPWYYLCNDDIIEYKTWESISKFFSQAQIDDYINKLYCLIHTLKKNVTDEEKKLTLQKKVTDEKELTLQQYVTDEEKELIEIVRMCFYLGVRRETWEKKNSFLPESCTDKNKEECPISEEPEVPDNGYLKPGEQVSFETETPLEVGLGIPKTFEELIALTSQEIEA